MILPVSIDYVNKKTKVTWGKPFRINDRLRTKDLNQLTRIIFNRVLKLSDQR